MFYSYAIMNNPDEFIQRLKQKQKQKQNKTKQQQWTFSGSVYFIKNIAILHHWLAVNHCNDFVI